MRTAGSRALLLAAHLAAYVALVVLVLPLGQAVAFVAVQQGVFGLYIGCLFAPNHKGMPIRAAGGALGLHAPAGRDLAQHPRRPSSTSLWAA